jgi:hypothetical protein
MARIIILDSFPVSCLGKLQSASLALTDQCGRWIISCIANGHRVLVPAIAHYETLRELERMGATAQIVRLRNFCFSEEERFIPLQTAHLETAAKLWA